MTGNNKQQGVTLIEILVVMTTLAIFITAVVSLFSSAITEQRKGMDRAYLLNQGSFVAEYIGRALRMSQKDTTGGCITVGSNYELTRGGQGIMFVNYRESDNCQEFYVEDKVFKVAKRISNQWFAQELTPSGLSVESLIFNISGQNKGDGLQPKATFSWRFRSTGLVPQDLVLQTTISQRELDVPQ